MRAYNSKECLNYCVYSGQLNAEVLAFCISFLWYLFLFYSNFLCAWTSSPLLRSARFNDFAVTETPLEGSALSQDSSALQFVFFSVHKSCLHSGRAVLINKFLFCQAVDFDVRKSGACTETRSIIHILPLGVRLYHRSFSRFSNLTTLNLFCQCSNMNLALDIQWYQQ